jgi:hypothetical protein
MERKKKKKKKNNNNNYYYLLQPTTAHALLKCSSACLKSPNAPIIKP